MRRILPVLMMVLILFGCAPREYETVRDVIPAGDPADAPCEIRVEVPAEAAIVSSTVDERVYEARNGDYTVTVRTIVTDGLDAAVYALTAVCLVRADVPGAGRLPRPMPAGRRFLLLPLPAAAGGPRRTVQRADQRAVFLFCFGS